MKLFRKLLSSQSFVLSPLQVHIPNRKLLRFLGTLTIAIFKSSLFILESSFFSSGRIIYLYKESYKKTRFLERELDYVTKSVIYFFVFELKEKNPH